MAPLIGPLKPIIQRKPETKMGYNMSKFKREDEESQYGFWRYWRLGLELLEVWKRLGGVGSQFYFYMILNHF